MLSRLHLRQPPTRKTVIELSVGGPVGRWFACRGWGAFVLPLPFLCIVFYWNTPEPSPFFLAFWAQYLAQHVRHGYRGNRYEREAYAIEQDARVSGLPAWAQADAPN